MKILAYHYLMDQDTCTGIENVPPTFMSFQEPYNMTLFGNRIVTDKISCDGGYSEVEWALCSLNWCPPKKEKRHRGTLAM